MASGRREAVKALGVVEATKKAITTVTVQDFSRQHLGIGAATISNARVDDLGSPSRTPKSDTHLFEATHHEHSPPNTQDRDGSSIVGLELQSKTLWSLLETRSGHD